MGGAISELISGKEDFGQGGDAPRKLLAQEARAEFDAWRVDPRWTADECWNVITFLWRDGDLKDEYRHIVMDRDLEGTLNDPDFRLEFLDVTANQLGAMLETFDDLTRNAWMRVRPQNLTYNSIQCKHLSSSYWMDPFKGSGNFAMIYGDPGSGKSDFSVFLMGHSLEVGHRVVSSILVPKDARPKGFSYHSSLRKVLLAMIDNLFEGYVSDFFMDELKITMNKSQAGKKSYINAEMILVIIRKLGGNFFGVVQDKKDTPTLVSHFHPVIFSKLSKQVAVVKTSNYLNVVSGIPKAAIPYDTGDIASLSMDVDVGAMNEYLGALPEETNKLSAARSFLGNQGKPTQIEVEIAVKTLYLMGHDQQEVASIMGYTQPGISKMLARHGIDARPVGRPNS